MAKTKISKLSQQTFTIKLGFGLYGLIVLGVIMSTIIPFAQLYSDAKVNHQGILTLILFLLLGALLPTLVAYLIGYKATRAKDNTTRRFNGVAFGVLAYWISTLLFIINPAKMIIDARIMPLSFAAIIVNMWAILVTVAILVVIAAFYVKTKHKKNTILSYQPYQAVLYAFFIIVSILLPILSQLQEFSTGSLLDALAYTGGITAIVGISYYALRKSKVTMIQRLTNSFFATSLGIIAMYGFVQIMPYFANFDNYIYQTWWIIAVLLGLATWAIYLRVAKAHPVD
ncbi:MAG: hypothetical protein ABI397_03240 [Candidatus Saccharimonas sp.]